MKIYKVHFTAEDYFQSQELERGIYSRVVRHIIFYIAHLKLSSQLFQLNNLTTFYLTLLQGSISPNK